MLSRTSLVAAVATIIMTVVLLPFGVVGVAGAWSLGAIIVAGYMLKLGLRALAIDLRSILRTLRPPFLATGFMVGVLFPVEWLLVHADRHGPLLGLLLLVGEGGIGLLVYLAALRVLDPEAVETLRRGARGSLHVVVDAEAPSRAA